MKSLIAVSIILCLVSSAALAGANVEVYSPSVHEVLLDSVPPPAYDRPIENDNIVIEKVIKVVPEQPEPASGSALGFYDAIPTLLLDNPLYPVELGLQFAPVGITGLARIEKNLLMFNQGYTRLHVGALATISDQAPSTLGLFFGIENYIARNVSLTYDLYPAVFVPNGLIVGQALIGGRFYF